MYPIKSEGGVAYVLLCADILSKKRLDFAIFGTFSLADFFLLLKLPD
jgi:hypothetical protein